MSTIASRFQTARELKGMSQEDVANCVGCGQTTISKIESGETKRSRLLGKISKCLEVRSEWLEYGDDPMWHLGSEVAESSATYAVNLIPVVSWIQAGETHVAFTDNQNQYEEKVKCKRKHSKFTYALEIRGDSMTAPEGAKYSFPEGYRIIVDPEQRGDTTDGIFVIAKEEGADAVTFKQLKYDGSRPYLNPLNNAHPKIFKAFRILGKVIDWDANLPKLP